MRQQRKKAPRAGIFLRSHQPIPAQDQHRVEHEGTRNEKRWPDQAIREPSPIVEAEDAINPFAEGQSDNAKRRTEWQAKFDPKEILRRHRKHDRHDRRYSHPKLPILPVDPKIPIAGQQHVMKIIGSCEHEDSDGRYDEIEGSGRRYGPAFDAAAVSTGSRDESLVVPPTIDIFISFAKAAKRKILRSGFGEVQLFENLLWEGIVALCSMLYALFRGNCFGFGPSINLVDEPGYVPAELQCQTEKGGES
jgi:hypothetical protein